MPRVAKSKPADSTANLGFEAKVASRKDLAVEEAGPVPRFAGAEHKGILPEARFSPIFLYTFEEHLANP